MDFQETADILVVLPTLGDRLETLKETLESIELQRKEVTLRLVVVTPTRSLEARALAKKYGAEIVDDPGVGISEAINAGIRVRDGEEFYAWMGDDDLFRPHGLKRLLELFQHTPEALVAYGACDYIDEHGNILAQSKAGRFAQFLLTWGPDLIPHPGSMIRLDALESIGCFDTSLKYAMDLDAFLKLKKLGKFACTTTPVSAFRWHPNSLTVASRKNSGAESEAVKAKYLPVLLRPISFIWVLAVRWASNFAAMRVSKRARALLG